MRFITTFFPSFFLSSFLSFFLSFFFFFLAFVLSFLLSFSLLLFILFRLSFLLSFLSFFLTRVCFLFPPFHPSWCPPNVSSLFPLSFITVFSAGDSSTGFHLRLRRGRGRSSFRGRRRHPQIQTQKREEGRHQGKAEKVSKALRVGTWCVIFWCPC